MNLYVNFHFKRSKVKDTEKIFVYCALFGLELDTRNKRKWQKKMWVRFHVSKPYIFIRQAYQTYISCSRCIR